MFSAFIGRRTEMTCLDYRSLSRSQRGKARKPAKRRLKTIPAATFRDGLSETSDELWTSRLDELGRRLKAARPHLSVVRKPLGLEYEATPYIRDVHPGWDELIEESYHPADGIDPAVYCCVVRRGEEILFCTTFLISRLDVIALWGSKGISYCDPRTGMAIVQIERLTGKVGNG
jgi:hypothetical protein